MKFFFVQEEIAAWRTKIWQQGGGGHLIDQILFITMHTNSCTPIYCVYILKNPEMLLLFT